MLVKLALQLVSHSAGVKSSQDSLWKAINRKWIQMENTEIALLLF